MKVDDSSKKLESTPSCVNMTIKLQMFECPKPPDDCSSEILKLYNELMVGASLSKLAVSFEEALLAASMKSLLNVPELTKVLFRILLQLDSKKPLHSMAIGCLTKLSQINADFYHEAVKTVILEVVYTEWPTTSMEVFELFEILLDERNLIWHNGLSVPPNNKEDLQFIQQLFCSLLQAIQNLWHINKGSPFEIKATWQRILRVMKNLIAFFQSESCTPFCNAVPDQVFHDLLEMAIVICYSEESSIDLRISCGLLSTHLYMYLWKVDLESLSKMVIWFKKPFKTGCEGELAILHGILCFQAWKHSPACLQDFCNLGDLLLGKVKLHRSGNTNETTSILVCRILKHIIDRLFDLSLIDENHSMIISVIGFNSLNHERLLQHIWLLWDHFLDCVRHLNKDIFKSFIALQLRLDHDNSKERFTQLARSCIIELCDNNNKSASGALSCLIPSVGADALIRENPTLIPLLLDQLGDHSFSAAATILLSDLFQQHYSEIGEAEWKEMWIPPFFDHFKKEMITFGYEDLLKRLLTTSKTGIFYAINLLSSFPKSDKNLSLHILCVKILLKESMSYREIASMKSNSQESEESHWRNMIPYSLFEEALSSLDETLRISAFNLICVNSKSTALFSLKELTLITSFIESNIDNHHPSFRQKFLSNLKKLLSRIQNGISMKSRQKKLKEDDRIVMNLHEKFADNLFSILIENLHPNANFPRCITTILSIELMFCTVFQPGGCYAYRLEKLLDRCVVDSLIYGLSDSFECNKVVLAKLLSRILKSKSDHRPDAETLLKSVWLMASSCRASEAITASYILETLISTYTVKNVFGEGLLATLGGGNCRLSACFIVVARLEEEIRIAQESLIKAASGRPMYGLLLSLRNLLSGVCVADIVNSESLWASLTECIIHLCVIVAEIVSPVVKHDAPEGRLPLEFITDGNTNMQELLESSYVAHELGLKQTHWDKETPEDVVMKAHSVCAQMVLLCGWRSVKELSLLLGTILKRIPMTMNNITLISHDHITLILDLYLSLLMETRHRGAFEQAYVGCKMIFEVLWESSDPKLSCLPGSRMKILLKEVFDVEIDKQLCSTRRSGGIPFIFQAILSSEPCFKGPTFFDKTMYTLYVSRTNAVHCLNIMRALFRDTKLGKSVLRHGTMGYKMSLNCHRDSSWEIRNAATLLFAAVTTRIFGVKKTHDDFHSKNSMSASVFFARFSNMRTLLDDSLHTCLWDIRLGKPFPTAYPILTILARLSPASQQSNESPYIYSAFVPKIINVCSCPMIQVRKLASRALAAFTTAPTLETLVLELCQKVALTNQNQLHGLLLCLNEIVLVHHSTIKSAQYKHVLRDKMLLLQWVAEDGNRCFMTRGSAIRLFISLLQLGICDEFSLSTVKNASLNLLFSPQEWYLKSPGYFYALEEATFFLLLGDVPDLLISQLITHSVREVIGQAWQYILSRESLSEYLYQIVLQMILKEKGNSLFSSFMFAAFVKGLTCSTVLVSPSELKEISEIIIHQLPLQCREDRLSSMIASAGKCVEALLRQKGSVDCKDLPERWLNEMLSFSSYEASSEVRSKVADAIAAFTQQPESELFERQLCKIFLELLVDDDLLVQESAAKGVRSFLCRKGDVSKSQLDTPVTARVALMQLLNYLAREGSSFSLGMLIQMALKEEEEDLFGLDEEDDRAFEKGEVNIYREEYQVARLVAEVFETNLSKHKQPLLFDAENVTKYLLVRNVSSNVLCPRPLSSVLEEIAEDIHFIFDHLSPLTKVTPFQVRHFEHWCCRLACRALLWKSLRNLLHQEISIDATRLQTLKKSLLQPKIFNNILLWLS